MPRPEVAMIATLAHGAGPGTNRRGEECAPLGARLFTRDGKITITKTSTPPWTFAATCTAAAGLCSVNQYADASPTITPAVHDDGTLCGR